MSTHSILIACGVGIVAGWLASIVMKGRGSGLLRDLVIGLLGGFVGHWLLPKTGIVLPDGHGAAILTAFAGAVVLLLAARVIGK